MSMEQDALQNQAIHEEKSQDVGCGGEALSCKRKKNRCVQGGQKNCKCGRNGLQRLSNMDGIGEEGQGRKGHGQQEKETLQNQTQK